MKNKASSTIISNVFTMVYGTLIENNTELVYFALYDEFEGGIPRSISGTSYAWKLLLVNEIKGKGMR